MTDTEVHTLVRELRQSVMARPPVTTPGGGYFADCAERALKATGEALRAEICYMMSHVRWVEGEDQKKVYRLYYWAFSPRTGG